MARSNTNAAGGVLAEVIRATRCGCTDGSLLDAFVARRDGSAFSELVRRHGPMVLGVCLRVLRHRQDAEDAFQATFLVLAQKAASVSPPDLVGNWLYGVALQTAIRARAKDMKRRQREIVVALPEIAVPEVGWDDVSAILDEELGRLPEHYRAVVLLCDVQGRTRGDAAAHLGCPEGSVSSRLSRARAMLARRLARRGLLITVGALGLLVAKNATAAVPASLLHATTCAAGCAAVGGALSGVVSAAVTSLAEGVTRTMLFTKLKAATLAALTVAFLGTVAVTGFGLAAGRHGIQGGPSVESPPALARSAPAAPRDDANDIQGTWVVLEVQPISREATKQERQRLFNRGVKLQFGPKEVAFAVDDEGFVRKAEYQLNTDQEPRRIEWRHGEEVTVRGIYLLDGDDLKLCLRLKNQSEDPPPQAPKSFDPREEGGTLFLLKREKSAVPRDTARKPTTSRAQRDAAEALKRMHAELERDDAGNVIGVRLHPQGGWLDEALPHLKAFAKLQRLALYSSNAQSESFRALDSLSALTEIELQAPFAGDGPINDPVAIPCPRLAWEKLPRIRTVRLGGLGIGDVQLQEVSRASGIKDIHLNGIRASRKGFAALKDIKRLDMLLVQSSHLTGDCVEAIAGINSVTALTLGHNDLGRDAFRHLASMLGLRYLNLESTNATDEDIAHLAPLGKLAHLDLGYNREITDVALRHLRGNKDLVCLRLHRTKVTPTGVAELMKSLPDLKAEGVPPPPAKGDDSDEITKAELKAAEALAKRGARLVRDAEGFVVSVRLTPRDRTLESALPHLHPMVRLRSLAIPVDVTPESFGLLRSLPPLREITLFALNTPSGPPSKRDPRSGPWLAWEKLDQLTSARFEGPGIDDGQLLDVATSPSIDRVTLFDVGVSAKGLAQLRTMKRLATLDLQAARVTGAHVAGLVAFEHLTSLSLADNAIGRNGFRRLESMTCLRSLNLARTGATNADVHHLASLPNLTNLDLSHNPEVTDAALLHLVNNKRLIELVLSGTGVSEAGAKGLQRSLAKLTPSGDWQTPGYRPTLRAGRPAED